MTDIIDKHFPFDVYHQGQKEAIKKIVYYLTQGVKHIVLEAPTGVGKSVISTTVHRVMAELKPGHRTTIITSTKGLQDQYSDDDRGVYSLKGKDNYHCHLGVGPYKSPGCIAACSASKCRPKSQCAYVLRRDHWCEVAPLRITNSSFQIVAGDGLVMEDENRANLIVVDECHNIDAHLVDHSSLELNVDDFKNIGRAMGANYIGKFLDFINLFVAEDFSSAFTPTEEHTSAAKKIATDLNSRISEMEKTLDESPPEELRKLDWMQYAIQDMDNISEQMMTFATTAGVWIVMDCAFSAKLTLKPAHAWMVAERGLFRKAPQFLHMSATICGYYEYIETLGLKPEDCRYVQVANPIPVKNRIIKKIPLMKVSGDFDRMRLAQAVDKILSKHPGENGIIHTVSFKLAEEIVEFSENKDRLMISNDRDAILSALSSGKGKVIISPSIETGYDLKGDLSRFQIVAKIPYLSLGDPWIRYNLSQSDGWYQRKTILRLVQACGRSIRGVNDYAATYVLDQNIDYLLRKGAGIAPDWFLESITSAS